MIQSECVERVVSALSRHSVLVRVVSFPFFQLFFPLIHSLPLMPLTVLLLLTVTGSREQRQKQVPGRM